MSGGAVVLRYAAQAMADGDVAAGEVAVDRQWVAGQFDVALSYAVGLGVERLLGEEFAAGPLGTSVYMDAFHVLNRHLARTGRGCAYGWRDRPKPVSPEMVAVLRAAADDHYRVVARVLRYAAAHVTDWGSAGFAEFPDEPSPWVSSVDVSAMVDCAARDVVADESGWSWQRLSEYACDMLWSELAASCGAQAPDWFAAGHTDADVVAALHATVERCAPGSIGGAA